LDPLKGLTLFNGLSFVVYGLLCLKSKFLEAEFNRWGVSKFRRLTGVLEMMGGLGQLLGFLFPMIGLLSSLGLFFLMFFGSIIRYKHGDSIFQSSPAILYCFLNAFLIYFYFI